MREERTPQLVTLVGVPGIGKSRLVSEILQIVDAAPELITWRQGRCLPYGEGISYWALSEMVKSQAGILEDDTADVASRKLLEAVAAVVGDATEAEWVTGHLRPLVGLASNSGASAESRGETFAAWRRFFEALGEQRPTVLVFEDLHWADDGLLEFVDGLVERATGVPLLVLCSARPELLVRRPGWGGGKANAVTLSLSALSEDDTARLIAEHLSQAVLPAEMQQTLLQRADGNPLFAEEYIRMLRDRGLLRREGETWRLDGAHVDVPETVQGIIAARLDALETEEKELLQAASVVGKVFWQGAVAAVAGVSAWEAEERLHALERKELVRRDRRAAVAGETEYAVRHVLVRDVAYGQIPRARRAELHARAAEWIDSLGADRAEDRAEMLAYHYVAALDLTRAAGGATGHLEAPARRALRDAGRRAYALSALDAASGFFRRALELWPTDDPECPRLMFELGNVLFLAEGEGGVELQEAADRLLATGDVEGAAEAESRLGYSCWVRGMRQEARRHSERSVELIAGLRETRTTAAIRAYAWRNQLLQGDRPPLEEGQRILTVTEKLGTSEDVLNARITLAIGRANLAGDVAIAIGDLESVLQEALRLNSFVAARAFINLGAFTMVAGDLGHAAELHRAGVEVARRFSSHHADWLEAAVVGDDFLSGAWDRAIEGASTMLEDREPSAYVDWGLHSVLAVVSAARGNRAAAGLHAAALIASARDIGDPQVLQPALSVCARLALDAGNESHARALIAELAESLASDAALGPDVIDGCITAESVGLGGDLAAALAAAVMTTPWITVGGHIVAGRFEEAGDLLYSCGDYAHAALVRLYAAERAGRETPELREAVAFYERVGATAYLARAERLLVEGLPETNATARVRGLSWRLSVLAGTDVSLDEGRRILTSHGGVRHEPGGTQRSDHVRSGSRAGRRPEGRGARDGACARARQERKVALRGTGLQQPRGSPGEDR